MANKVEITNNILRMLSCFFSPKALSAPAWSWLLAFTNDLLQIKIKCKAEKTTSGRTTPISSLMAKDIKLGIDLKLRKWCNANKSYKIPVIGEGDELKAVVKLPKSH